MDYRSYRLSLRQIGETALTAVSATLLIAWLFYGQLFPLLFTPGIFLLLYVRRIRRETLKRRELLVQQFLDLLRSLSASLLAGYSMENALRESLGEMRLLHGEGSYILTEIGIIRQGLQIHVPLEDLFRDFAARSGSEEIEEFAEIFAIARKSSGGIGRIVENTAAHISERRNTGKEIEVAIASRQMEQKVMNGIPLLMLLYLKLTDPEYLQVLYGNLFGAIFMSLCLAVYLAAMVLSEKLSTIEM